MFYTYTYRDPSILNAKGFPEEIYIGKGMKKRAWSHLSRKDKHPLTHRIQFLKKQNIEPLIEIIPALDEQHAFFMEECLISIIGRKDLGLGSLLNLTDGGENWGCGSKSIVTRQRMSAAHKGKKFSAEHRKKLSVINTGKRHPQEILDKIQYTKQKNNKPVSIETRQRMSDIRKGKQVGEENPFFGKKHSEETKLKMRESRMRYLQGLEK